MSASRVEQARGRHPVFREASEATLERLALYEVMLRKWQATINLVAKSTLDDVWVRHFADSLEVSQALPAARQWADLGSGAGFPGLVTAIRYADEAGASVHLIESDQRKCAFLRAVSRETGAPAIVHCARIEVAAATLADKVEAVSARALAPLPALLDLAGPFLEEGAIGIFSKGRRLDAELTASAVADRYQIRTVASGPGDSSRLIIVRRKLG